MFLCVQDDGWGQWCGEFFRGFFYGFFMGGDSETRGGVWLGWGLLWRKWERWVSGWNVRDFRVFCCGLYVDFSGECVLWRLHGVYIEIGWEPWRENLLQKGRENVGEGWSEGKGEREWENDEKRSWLRFDSFSFVVFVIQFKILTKQSKVRQVPTWNFFVSFI